MTVGMIVQLKSLEGPLLTVNKEPNIFNQVECCFWNPNTLDFQYVTLKVEILEIVNPS
jgi:hypothetical protein